MHDEVILEGPTESSARAQELVVQLMKNPNAVLVEPQRRQLYGSLAQPLLVELSVDSNIADTWYEAK